MLRLTAESTSTTLVTRPLGDCTSPDGASVCGPWCLGFAGLRPVGDALAIDPGSHQDGTRSKYESGFRQQSVHVRVLPERYRQSANHP